MQTQPDHSRRSFLHRTVQLGGALALAPAATLAAQTAAPAPPAKFPLIAFSKPFQSLGPEQTADLVAEVGWDGIECPVRPKGQIEPERAPDELPRLAAALRARQRDIQLVTSAITSLRDPHAETVLRTTAKLGIRRVRLGFWKYPADRSPADYLKEVAPALKDLAAACQELGLQAGFQNHSGRDYVGAPVWDVFSIIRDLNPRHMGMCFDIGHATIEGGLSWPIEARLMAPFYTAVFVKDFIWRKEARGWKAAWCNLGEGMVDRAFFTNLKRSGYVGPIAQHHEYPLGTAAEMTAHFKRDLQVLREWLA